MQKEANYLLLSCEDVKQVSSANANIIFWHWRWLPHRSSKRQSLYFDNNYPIQDYVHPQTIKLNLLLIIFLVILQP